MTDIQKLIEKVKAFIKEKESLKGSALTDEDFIDMDTPCGSKPEIIVKDGYTYWLIDGELFLDRANEQVISNATTYNQLLRILASNPDVIANAEVEAEEKADEEKEAELHMKFGDDYDLVFDKKKVDQGRSRRPGARQLRTVIPHVAVIEIGENAICEVFNNGYAVYDNGNRRVVLWVPDCGSATYYFTGLRDKEKEYLSQKEEIGLDVLGDLPWYQALMIAGENRIEYNMDHPKSKGNSSDFDLYETEERPATHWVGACHFDSPEEAYLKKEAAEERKKALTDKQKMTYEMYFEWELTMEEIAKADNVSIGTVQDRLYYIKQKLGRDKEKFFS